MLVGDTPAYLALSRAGRAVIRIPEGAISGDVVLALGDGPKLTSMSNALGLRVAVPMAESLHPVANPAVDADGTVYATVSGGARRRAFRCRSSRLRGTSRCGRLCATC